MATLMVLYVMGMLAIPTMCCIREYHELERSLLTDPRNIDSMMRAFFPPNQEQAVVMEVSYQIDVSGNATGQGVELRFTEGNSCRNQPQFCKHRDEERTNCTYLYRWSASPMYLFTEPRLLNDMSFSILPGTELRIRQANLVVAEICNKKEDQIIDINGDIWDLPVFLLTQLTTLLRSYAINREGTLTSGIDLASQGYASFCKRSPQTDSADFVVVEYENEYINNLIFTGITMILLAIFACMSAPLLLHFQYINIYEHMKTTLHSQFLVWAIVTVLIAADHLLSWLPLFYHYVGWAQAGWNTRYDRIYPVVIAFWALVCAVDIPVAAVIVYSGRKTDFPVPHLIKVLVRFPLFCLKPCTRKKRNAFTQFVAVWHSIIAIQLFCFYSVVVFVAFIARPLHTAVLFIFYIAFLFFLITSLMLLFATTQVKNEKEKLTPRIIVPRILLTVIFILLVFFISFFAFTFLRITIFVGDGESRQIPGIVGSLIPTAVIAVLGFLARKLLSKYNEQPNGEQQDSKEDNVDAFAVPDVDGIENQYWVEGNDGAANDNDDFTGP